MTDEIRTSPSTSMLKDAFQIYFERCHRHPIWLFDSHELDSYIGVADEVILSILALVSHFDPARFSYQKQLKSARAQVMSQLANGSVRLSTIEALCLISQSCFFGGSATTTIHRTCTDAISWRAIFRTVSLSTWPSALSDGIYTYIQRHPIPFQSR